MKNSIVEKFAEHAKQKGFSDAATRFLSTTIYSTVCYIETMNTQFLRDKNVDSKIIDEYKEYIKSL